MEDTNQWRPVQERRDDQTYAFVQYLWGARHRDDLARRDHIDQFNATESQTKIARKLEREALDEYIECLEEAGII